MANIKKSPSKAPKSTSKAVRVSASRSKPAEKASSTKAPGKGSKGTPAAERNAHKEVATIDRRDATDRRCLPEQRRKKEPVAVERRSIERRKKVTRRRQIDPTTCERDYTIDEVEFMNALDDYKRTSGRMFPTCSEVLEVLRGLGYMKSTSDSTNTPPEGISECTPEGNGKPLEVRATEDGRSAMK